MHLLNLKSNLWENLNMFNNTCEKTSIFDYEICQIEQDCFVSRIFVFYFKIF